MSNEKNEYLLQRYEAELRQLDKQLILQEGENFSLDAFLNEIKEKRKQVRGRLNTPINDDPIARTFGYSDGIHHRASNPAPGTYVL